MPRPASAAGRGTKRQRTAAPDTAPVDEPAVDDVTSPLPHIDPAVNSLLQNSAAADPTSPPASVLSSHYFDAHIGSGRNGGGKRRHQRSLLAVRQEAMQAGFDLSLPLLCKDATERSERLLAEHRQLFPKWHMQLKSAQQHTPAAVHQH